MSIEELKILQADVIKKNRKCNLIGGIITGSFILLTIIILLLCKVNFIFILIFTFIEFIFAMIILTIIKNNINCNDIKKFYSEFKKIFLLKSLNQVFEKYEYNFEKGFSREYIYNIGVLNIGDSLTSNDYVSSSYKGIKFEQSDLCIMEKHEEKNKDGETEEVWETIFMGKLMVFDFNKPFQACTEVVTRNFAAASWPRNKSFYKVNLEDAVFNQYFCAYAENEHEAFYILTPHFMEKIKNITNKLKCGVLFGFIDNKLYIALNSGKDSFEYYNIFKPINEKEIEEEMIKDLKLITDFVNELNLDNNLFK